MADRPLPLAWITQPDTVVPAELSRTMPALVKFLTVRPRIVLPAEPAASKSPVATLLLPSRAMLFPVPSIVNFVAIVGSGVAGVKVAVFVVNTATPSTPVAFALAIT